ncbi:eukaryotic translation initiation factor 4E [Choiromyces venosus 120613-1]|uniref:Eukaryotic translation initiation factor 4E n=1 Tax=Choiromyces venosus 120613-1 TaxID=1336337 RepID=A0A3N4KA67_9PEZI|nr:eukaryotic translation initiation factor 4E [Choiromyces venosus 120613-1]
MSETVASSSAIPDEQRPLDQIPISPPNGEVEEETGEDGLALPGNKEQLTVFHSADNFNVKHPLMNKWTLWYTKPPNNRGENNWNDLLKEVVTFDSVEEFWGIYNNIAKTSELSLKSDYHLFKTGVRPEWEDAQNKHGGKWAYQFKRGSPVDDLWLNVMLAAIGETLESDKDKEIMGVVVNVRKVSYRIGLWTKTTGAGKGTPKEAALMEIGRKFKEVLKLGDKDVIEFSCHTESAHSGQSRAKAKHVV